MSHSVAEAAARAVKNSAKGAALERGPEQILKDIRNNLNSRLAVTSDDIRFLLAQYDAAIAEISDRNDADARVRQLAAESAEVQPGAAEVLLMGAALAVVGSKADESHPADLGGEG